MNYYRGYPADMSGILFGDTMVPIIGEFRVLGF